MAYSRRILLHARLHVRLALATNGFPSLAPRSPDPPSRPLFFFYYFFYYYTRYYWAPLLLLSFFFLLFSPLELQSSSKNCIK
jgi:hypothetical protein